MKDTNELDALIGDAWQEWDRARDCHPLRVPAESAPVLWFGDLERYLKSERRVVTIGVNPGPKTFSQEADDDAWARYPSLKSDGARDAGQYRAALNAFEFDSWFQAFSPLVRAFDAQYPAGGLERMKNEVLHLDLSPIMTEPVWFKCGRPVQTSLRSAGVVLLARLLDLLNPEVSFMSVSQPHFDAVKGALGVDVGELRGIGLHTVRRCEWARAGQLLWIRKTGARPVNPGADDSRLLGAWMAGGVDPTGPFDENTPAQNPWNALFVNGLVKDAGSQFACELDVNPQEKHTSYRLPEGPKQPRSVFVTNGGSCSMQLTFGPKNAESWLPKLTDAGFAVDWHDRGARGDWQRIAVRPAGGVDSDMAELKKAVKLSLLHPTV